LAVMGIGPILSWRGMRLRTLAQALRMPTGILVVVAILEAVFGSTHYFAIGAMGLSAFVITIMVSEYVRVLAVRKRKGESVLRGFRTIVARNPRRYAGYI